MATTANLLRLPPELMLRVSTHLTTPELACFRLTCKQIETNLFESFAREFFTKRQFMLEEVSLEALAGIANHKTLAPYMKEVIISVEKLLHTEAGRRRDQEEPDAFMATGHAHVLLASAFSKLPNLHTIGIRDYDGRGRWRDGENAKWRSYGWSSGNKLCNHAGPRMHPAVILPLLLYSLGDTSTRPERIEVFLRRDRVPDHSFDLSPRFMQSGAILVLSNLKALLLSLEDRSHVMYAAGSTDPYKKPEYAFCHLKDFLRKTPLLEHLRLNFAHQGLPSWRIDALLAWIGTSPGPDVNMVPAPIRLDHLTTFELGMLAIEPHTLLAIFSKFANLEAISLWKIALQPTPASSDEGDHDSSCMWAYYLRKIGEAFQTPENVKSFMIGWVTEVAHGVRFAGKTSVDGNGQKTFEDAEDVIKFRKQVGSNACTWLEELAEKAFVPPQDESSDESDSIDSEIEQSQGMDEDESDDEDQDE